MTKVKKKKGFLQSLLKRSKSVGKRYNYSLLAEIFALLFLGTSDHQLFLYDREILFALTLFTALIAYISNE